LLSVLGERLFRRISLGLQGLAIAVLVVLLLLFPVLSGVVPTLLQSSSAAALCFPPFWFLGIYQQLMDGPSALPIYTELARIGIIAIVAAAAIAAAAYPIAYLRRVRQLVEGGSAHPTRSTITAPLRSLLHATAVRPPIRRAVYHFIGQTLLRVPRYRIYLVLYGGVGISIVVASLLRFTTVHGQVTATVSADGLRASIGITAFWVIAGLRMAFVSSGNQRGGWIWRIVHGRPPGLDAALAELSAARIWAALCAAAATLAMVGILHTIAPPELRTWQSIAAQALVSIGMCLLLSDAFFLNEMTIPFTGETEQTQPNPALTLLKFFTFFPLVIGLSLYSEQWIEADAWHLAAAAAIIAVAHIWLRIWHRDLVRQHCNQPSLEEGEEDFPMKLGLRY
jgi:hypothetical protein